MTDFCASFCTYIGSLQLHRLPNRGHSTATMAPKRKGPTTAAKSPAQKPAAAKKTKPYRTPQTPFEQTEEKLYDVDKITAMRFNKGAREYLVRWEGYAAAHDTWEPMENLVGCAEQIRVYEKQREADDKKHAADALERRQKAKDDAAAEAESLKARAAEQALAGEGGIGAPAGDGEEAAADAVLKKHKGKSCAVWKHFDLSVDKPSCKLFKADGFTICDAMPSAAAGTQNYWSHLWAHHRTEWYEAKRVEGKLNAAGNVELAKLKEGLANLDKASNAQRHRHGGEFLSAQLPPDAKETLDRIVSEWIVDEDQAFNAASTPGYRYMMATATGEKYDGCCPSTVMQHAVAMGMEGKEECADFHRELLADGVKPAVSGDLWSKNSTALFGLVSHGIRREVTPDPAGGKPTVEWNMVEKLAGAVPCSKHRHTGERIGQMSDSAWAESGLTRPTEQIFARVSDNGSNMIKGWEEGFQTPCADHTEELSVNLYTQHPRLAPTFDKGRGIVGYFNSSVVGYNEDAKGLHACQKLSQLPETRLTQDVKTRWRSTFAMTDSLRANMEPLLLYDVKNPNAADGFQNNRLSLEDWAITNQTVALLSPLANASTYLEGKNYPTSNLVLPSMYGCCELLAASMPVRQPWDGKLLQPNELRPEVVEGRQVLHSDLVDRWKTKIPEQLKRFYFIATICDPRQKGLCFPGVSDDERRTAHDWFTAEFCSLWDKNSPPVPGPAPAPAPAPATAPMPTPAAAPASAAASMGSFLDFMTSIAHLQPAEPEQAPTVRSEVERYLELPAVDMKVDVLKWWAENEINFPALSVMARQYLGVPATSASAERLFSLAGRAFDDMRQNMKEEMLEMLMWARVNREKRWAKREC